MGLLRLLAWVTGAWIVGYGILLLFTVFVSSVPLAVVLLLIIILIARKLF